MVVLTAQAQTMDIVGVKCDCMTEWRDCMTEWRDYMTVWRDYMTAWRDYRLSGVTI